MNTNCCLMTNTRGSTHHMALCTRTRSLAATQKVARNSSLVEWCTKDISFPEKFIHHTSACTYLTVELNMLAKNTRFWWRKQTVSVFFKIKENFTDCKNNYFFQMIFLSQFPQKVTKLVKNSTFCRKTLNALSNCHLISQIMDGLSPLTKKENTSSGEKQLTN